MDGSSGVANAVSNPPTIMQLAIGHPCGFASTMEGTLLTEEEQWAKLQLVVEVAREVWG
jgi:5-methyltetrahydropteroyltriglutamate--homocysteine methyltransferase